MSVPRLQCIALFLIVSMPAAFGQADKSREAEWVVSIEDIRIEVEAVQLMFLVRDGDGNFIRNLKTADFQLTENGETKSITVQQQRDIPINACLLLDTSWSIGSLLNNALKTATHFFNGLSKEEVSVVTFAARPKVLLPWSRGISSAAPFKDIKLEGRTALYDSLLWVINDHFRGVQGKKLIFLFTDGIDNLSQSNLQDVFRAATERNVVIYAIMSSNPVLQNVRQRVLAGKQSPNISKSLEGMLQQQNSFIDRTLRYGGRTIFSNAFEDLEKVYGRIIEETKSQYVLSFPSLPGREVQQHEIHFVIKPEIPGRIFVQIGQ
ncbi:MAG: VWA domain-containing protein [Acidobacteriota bacterium]